MSTPSSIQDSPKNRPFWQRYLILIAIDSLVVFGLAGPPVAAARWPVSEVIYDFV